jgi:hypothetical protein
MALEACARACEARHPSREAQEVANEGTARGALVAAEDFDRALMQALDLGKPEKRDDLSRDDHDERNGGEPSHDDAHAAEPRGTARKVLDQVDDGKRGREHREPECPDPEHRDPRPAALRLWQARHFGRGHRGRNGRDHGRIVVPEDSRPAGAKFAHFRRSPIRNCRARSSRIWGSAGGPSPPSSSGGGRNRRKR